MFSQQVIINDILPYTQATLVAAQTVIGTDWTANAASDVAVYYTPFGDAPDDATQQLTSNQFSVAFIGGSQQVQVTLVTPANQGDIATVIRNTPADRMNLYTNTNFTPTMLNQDFGILTLVDQQAQLVDQLIGPRYNYSATITPVVDTILPILLANQIWVKNSGNTAIIGLDVPSSGFAPANGTYVLLTPNAALPDAQALSSFGASGILAFNIGTQQIVETSILGTSNQITVTNGLGVGTIGLAIASNPVIPGTAGMGIPEGTTAQRVIPGSNISLRFNTDLGALEYYNSGWIQLIDDVVVQPGLINELAWYAATGQTVSGLPTVAAGVLTTVASVPTWASQLSLALGGTNAALTASNGGIVYSTASALGILNGTSTPNLPLLSQNASAPIWGPFALSMGGAITTAGALTLSGAHDATFTFTGPTGVTFPTSGTLATTTSSLATINADAGSATVSGGAITLSGGTTGLTTTGSASTIDLTGTLAINHGGTGVTSVTTAPTATAWAGWDANKNFSANNVNEGFTSTATAGATTTLDVTSTYFQYFTGSTTQTVQMPVVSTLVQGMSWYITNLSSGAVTVQSSGGNTIQTMAQNTSMIITCILTSGTDAASWYADYPLNGSTGTVNPGTSGQLAYYGATGSAVSGTTTGTGVLTALGINVGSAGAFVTFNGALGTPSSGTLTNATGLPVSTGINGLGTGVATALGINVGSAGAFITFNGAAGTPSSLTLTNATGLPLSTGVTGTITNSNNGVTMTQKKGTAGGGTINTSSASLVDVDGTNLAYSVTIPSGYKLVCTAVGSFGNSNVSGVSYIAITDTSTATVLAEQQLNASLAGGVTPFALSSIITGDGASHTVKLQFAAVSNTAIVVNDSTSRTPTMTFMLMPSN